MSGKAVTQLGLGLLGLWLLVQSVWAFLYALTGASLASSSFGILPRIVPAFLFLAFSYVLVFHSEAVAIRLFPAVLGAEKVTTEGAGHVAVLMLGLLLLGTAIPRLAEFVPGVLRPQLMAHEIVVMQRFALAGVAGQIAFALWLIRRPEQAMSLSIGAPEQLTA